MTELRSRLKRFVAQSMIGVLACVPLLILIPTSAHAAGSDVVINALQIGGANAADEYVELYNSTAQAYDLSLNPIYFHILNSSGTDSFKPLLHTNHVIPPHGYYLLVDASATASLKDLADATYFHSGNSLVANGAAYISPSVSNDVSRAYDLVGWGSQPSDGFETTATPNLAANQTLQRNVDGVDTDNNANDFAIIDAMTPKNSLFNNDPTPVVDPSPTPTATTTATVIVSTPVSANLVFHSAGAVDPRTHFGPDNVSTDLFTSVGALNHTSQPQLTFVGRNLPDVVIPLNFVGQVNNQDKWTTQYNFAVYTQGQTVEGKVAQDGTEAVSPVLSGKTFTTTNTSFTVDTFVNKPVVQINSKCSGQQDSLSFGTTDSDVTKIYIYKSPTADANSLVAVMDVNNGKADDVNIGDNAFDALYSVAQDSTGNRSDVVAIANQITMLPIPTLQLQSNDGSITVSWPNVNNATSYILKFRKVGDVDWQQKTVESSPQTIAVLNEKAYEFALASSDMACNQSSFANQKAAAHPASFYALAARGGMGDSDMQARYEAQIFAESFQVDGTKDGTSSEEARLKAEQDKKIAEQKAAEEKKQQEEQQKQEAQKQSQQVKDRSRLIIGLAILLIVAGTVIAAYSWYKGDDSTGGSDEGASPKSDEDATATEESVAPGTKPKTKKTTRGKRKTRW